MSHLRHGTTHITSHAPSSTKKRTQMNEFVTHIQMSHVTYIKESCHTCVMAHTRHVTHTLTSAKERTPINEFVTHIQMSHVTYVKKSRHTCVIAHTRRVTRTPTSAKERTRPRDTSLTKHLEPSPCMH